MRRCTYNGSNRLRWNILFWWWVLWSTRFWQYLINAIRCWFLSIYASSQKGNSYKLIIIRLKVYKVSSLYHSHVEIHTPWLCPKKAMFMLGVKLRTASLVLMKFVIYPRTQITNLINLSLRKLLLFSIKR